jgi:uncharacterized protein
MRRRAVRLMCDEMLLRLGRWLRAAGCDTAIAGGGIEDAALITRCVTESRVRLTRDRRLAACTEAFVPILLLSQSAIDSQARALVATLGINWQRAPFNPLRLDNAILEAAPPEPVAEVPPRSREAGRPFLRCSSCGRLYWPGGHVRRMRQRLSAWT